MPATRQLTPKKGEVVLLVGTVKGLFVNVFVGDESIRFTGGLGTPVPHGAEIWILPAVSGG
jgi:sulfur-carrier protein